MMSMLNSFTILLCGLGVFLLGVRMLGKSVELLIVGKAKAKLEREKNPVKGLLIGTTTAAVAHSSSAICVLSLGLCSSGMIALPFAASIVLGANIGTTFTALFSALSVLDISLYLGLLVVVGLGVGMAKKQQIAKWSQPLMGLGLIFIGLNIVSNAFDGSIFANFLANLFAKVSFAPLLILLSFVFTAIVQSSTLTTTIAIGLSVARVITPYNAMFLVLGADSGTCITTLIASIGGHPKAKQLAKFQVWFNVLSTIVFGIILTLLHPLIAMSINQLGNPAFAIALFHFGFNAIGAVVTLPFLPYLFAQDKPIPVGVS